MATALNIPQRRDATPRIKQDVFELAAFGGSPAFSHPLHVGRPNIAAIPSILARIRDVLNRAWLTNDGTYVRQFESAVAEKAEVKNCIATCNGTTALQLATAALGMSDEVIVPSLTFVATPHALAWQRATPVFADISPRTWTLDPASVEQRLTERTSGIVGVHLWGQSCDTIALADIAKRYGLPLLFDASHALGCGHLGKAIGSFGHAEVFSFHATKFVNSAEGGAIVTNDDELAQRCRNMRNFGFSQRGQVSSIGTNGKMSEISAAIGLTSLEHIDDFVRVNRRNHFAFRQSLSDIPGLSVKSFNRGQRCNFQYIVVDVDEEHAGLNRDELLHILRHENVLARRYFYPGCHRYEAYENASTEISLPVTDDVTQRVLVLPNGVNIERGHIRLIGQILRVAVAHADQVRSHLRSQPLHVPVSDMGQSAPAEIQPPSRT